MREFESGATRDDDEGKPDYEAYLSPRVIRRFGEYMLKHQFTPSGRREGDNWQKGFGLPVIMKSMWRHFMDVWVFHRGAGRDEGGDQQEALCALIFNASAYLHTLLEDEAYPNSLSEALDAAIEAERGALLADLAKMNPFDNKLGLQAQQAQYLRTQAANASKRKPLPNTEPCEHPLNREAQRVQGEPDKGWGEQGYV